MCEASPYVQWLDVYISSAEHNYKYFSMQTQITHMYTIFEYCHASVTLDKL